MIWSGTTLKGFWRHLLALLLPLGIAVGATLWYERRLYSARPPRRAEEA
jgi:hypothetical protein